MKAFAFTLAIIALSQLGWAAGEPEIINEVPKHIYIPSGFDNNDNAQLVFEGEFTNSCYRTGVTNYFVNDNTKTITVENKVQFYSNQMCLMVIMHYKKELNLGVVEEGNYKVEFASSNGPNREMGVMNINPARTDSADDVLYAPVQSATYNKADKVLSLKGNFSNSCLRLENVITRRPAAPNNNVIEVLPQAKLLDAADCEAQLGDYPFTHAVSLENAGTGRVLVHIRSLNGQAVNLIENL
tara:strand:- start:81019 stop:81741 length:723 start_codon:yes stop_codon:yes gene_type:complete